MRYLQCFSGLWLAVLAELLSALGVPHHIQTGKPQPTHKHKQHQYAWLGLTVTILPIASDTSLHLIYITCSFSLVQQFCDVIHFHFGGGRGGAEVSLQPCLQVSAVDLWGSAQQSATQHLWICQVTRDYIM